MRAPPPLPVYQIGIFYMPLRYSPAEGDVCEKPSAPAAGGAGPAPAQGRTLDLNLNQNSVSRCESGSRDLSSGALVMFADYYHVSIDYLLFRTDEPLLNGAPRRE